MTDRILFRCMWLMIMTLIAGSAMGSLVLLYSGLFSVIARRYETGVMVIGVGILLGVVAWLLCKHSDDLIDRRV